MTPASRESCSTRRRCRGGRGRLSRSGVRGCGCGGPSFRAGWQAGIDPEFQRRWNRYTEHHSARAAAGSTIEIYATGEGQTNPPGVDGVLNNGPTLPSPVLPVSVAIGGKPAQVTYVGAAPGGVAGFTQLNVVIPSGLTPGAQPLVLTVGTNMTPASVTVWVK